MFPAECSGASSSPWWDCSVLALLSPSPTWPGDEDGVISLHVSCHSWMFPTVSYIDGLFPSLLPPGPWESIPAFNIPPSLSAKYYIQGISVYPGSCHPHIPTATQRDQNLPQGKGRTGRISSCLQELQPSPWLQILTRVNSCIFHLCSRNAHSPSMGAPSAHAPRGPIPRAAGNNVMSCLFPPSHEV